MVTVLTVQQPVNWLITRLAFRNRFTTPEKTALYTAAATSVPLQIYMDDLAATDLVDLTNSQTLTDLQALETAGILAAGRALIICTTPPLPSENA